MHFCQSELLGTVENTFFGSWWWAACPSVVYAVHIIPVVLKYLQYLQYMKYLKYLKYK